MREVVIITDSCSDLDKNLRDKYAIDYVKMNTVCDGKETPASLDWEYYSPKELYDTMRNGKRVYTTQVPMEEFTRVFGKYASEGKDIVYIACSGVLSASVNTGAVVAEKVKEKYPETEIICIDTKTSCLGEGIIAIKAAELRDEGRSAKEIADEIYEYLKYVNMFCTVHTLEYLRRAGRVKATTSFFGNLMGVKPIMISDAGGYNVAIKKVRGRQNSIAECVNLAKENITDPENQTIYVTHGDCLEEAEEFKKLLLKEIPVKDVYVSYIGPIIGASTGPGALAVFFTGKEVTIKG